MAVGFWKLEAGSWKVDDRAPRASATAGIFGSVDISLHRLSFIGLL